MEDQPTCGKGLAAHSVIPQKLGELIASVARVLEVHMEALDLTDESSRIEHSAYAELAKDHREVATELIATASRMAGYRGLPMGKHDENVMSGQRSIEAFENFVKLERELLTLLQHRLEEDREMLVEMREAPGR
jgi:hypothetical protein